MGLNIRSPAISWPSHSLIRSGCVRGGAFLIVWWALTGGEASSWAIGVPAIFAATAASLVLRPQASAAIRPLAVLRFIPFFLGQSLKGGIDVVRRAFHPDLPLAPSLVRISVDRLRPAEQVLFTLAACLIPGTLSARLEGNELLVHALDRNQPVEESLDLLQEKVRAIFAPSNDAAAV